MVMVDISFILLTIVACLFLFANTSLPMFLREINPYTQLTKFDAFMLHSLVFMSKHLYERLPTREEIALGCTIDDSIIVYNTKDEETYYFMVTSKWL